MIARYSRPEMAFIWTDQHKYSLWLQVELAVCHQMAAQGLISQKDWKQLEKKCNALLKKGGPDPKKIDELEAVTRHDVIAFTTAVAQEIGSVSRFIHFGLTSSDVVDTALCLALGQAGEILLADVEALLKTLKKQAQKFKRLPTMGRSHGIFAEPTSFGLKFLGWHAEWKRNRARLQASLEQLRVGKLSGAVGVNPHWGPEFEERVLGRLRLKREPVSTQVIPRDRHAELLSTFAILGASLERIAVELRHLQRSEVGEVSEGFHPGQKGSSAMPHKKNPISSENITGCARLLRSYAQAALENVALWHERDISHSSVERVILPDATLILNYALNRMRQVLEDLQVHTESIHQNLNEASPAVFSGHFLLELVKAGATREQAYLWVQDCSHRALAGQGVFVDLMTQKKEVRALLTEKKIRELGSLQYQLRHVDQIFQMSEK
ncbi:MAG: adenylosuccinate lyase [Bdellovibrionia bacterium]